MESLKRLNICDPENQVKLTSNDIHPANVSNEYPVNVFTTLKYVESLCIEAFFDVNFTTDFSNMSSLQVLDISWSYARKLYNNSFSPFVNSSLSYLSIQSSQLDYIELCAFCGLRLKTLILRDNVFLMVDVAMASLFGLKGLEMNTVDFEHIGTGQPNQTHILHHPILMEICTSYFNLASSYIRWIDSSLLTPNSTTFGQCIEHLDLSSNEIRGDIKFFLLAKKLFKLKSIHLESQYKFSLDRAACVLNNDARQCVSRQHYRQDPIPQTFFVNLTRSLEVLNYSSANDYFNGPPITIHILGADNLAILDLSYGAIGNCNTTITGLNNLQVILIYHINMIKIFHT